MAADGVLPGRVTFEELRGLGAEGGAAAGEGGELDEGAAG